MRSAAGAGMLAALALADYNVLDEWRKKMGGTVKSTVDPMTGHVSSLHRASSGTGWGGYEDGWDEELEARAAGLVANVFSDMPLTELARDTKRRPELAQLMKAWFDPDPAGVAKEYEDDRAKLMKSFPEKYGKGCRVACMMACIKKCPPEIHLATCEDTNCAPQCRQKCIEMGME